jgi:hypothetical protein
MIANRVTFKEVLFPCQTATLPLAVPLAQAEKTEIDRVDAIPFVERCKIMHRKSLLPKHWQRWTGSPLPRKRENTVTVPL